MPDKIDALYDATSNDYNLGTREEFRQKMGNPEKAKAFYTAAASKYNLGNFDDFTKKIGLTGAMSDAEKAKVMQEQQGVPEQVEKVITPNETGGVFVTKEHPASYWKKSYPEFANLNDAQLDAQLTKIDRDASNGIEYTPPNASAAEKGRIETSNLNYDWGKGQHSGNIKPATIGNQDVPQVSTNVPNSMDLPGSMVTPNLEPLETYDPNKSLYGDTERPTDTPFVGAMKAIVSPITNAVEGGIHGYGQFIKGGTQLAMSPYSEHPLEQAAEGATNTVLGGVQTGFSGMSLVNPSLMMFNAGNEIAGDIASRNPVTKQVLDVANTLPSMLITNKESPEYVKNIGHALDIGWQFFVFHQASKLGKGVDYVKDFSNDAFKKFMADKTPEDLQKFQEEHTPEEIQNVAEKVQQNTVTNPKIEGLRKEHTDLGEDIKRQQDLLQNPDLSDKAKAILQTKLDTDIATHAGLEGQIQAEVVQHQQNESKVAGLAKKVDELSKDKAELEKDLTFVDEKSAPLIQSHIDELDSQIKEHEKAIKELKGENESSLEAENSQSQEGVDKGNNPVPDVPELNEPINTQNNETENQEVGGKSGRQENGQENGLQGEQPEGQNNGQENAGETQQEKVEHPDVEYSTGTGVEAENEKPLNKNENESNQKNGEKGSSQDSSQSESDGEKGRHEEDGRQELLNKGGEQPPKSVEQKILDAKAKIEAIRNRKKLEGEQGIITAKSGFSFDADEIDAYKELVSAYIEQGINGAKEIIKQLREDFSDLLAGATDKDIEDQIITPLTEKESVEVSAKNAINDPENKIITDKETSDSIDKAGKTLHDSVHDWFGKAAEDVKNKTRKISTEEQAAYRMEQLDTQNNLLAINKEINKSKDDPSKLAQLRIEQARLEAHAENVSTVIKRQGSIWGYFGRDRQKLIKEDYTATALFEKAKSYLKKGKELTEKTKELFRDVDTHISEDIKELDKAEKSIQAQWDAFNKANEEIKNRDKEIADLKEKLKTAKFPNEKTYGAKNKLVTNDAYQAARQSIKGKMFSAAIPPPELFTIATYHLEAGSHEFVDFSKKMIKDLGAKVKPYLRDLYFKGVKDLKDRGIKIVETPASEVLTPDEAAAKQRRDTYIKGLETRLNNLTEKNDNGDFTKPVKRPPLSDPEIRSLKAQIEAQKLRANMEIKRIQLENQGKGAKTLDFVQRYHVFNLLLDQNILGKIIGHTMTEAITKVADQGAESAWRTLFNKMNKGSGLGKPTLKSVKDYYSTFMTSPAYIDAFTALKDGQNSIDKVHGAQHMPSSSHKWLDIPGNLHNAEKTFMQTAEYKSSLERRINQQVKNEGLGSLSDPEVRSRLEAEAAADSVSAKLMNKTQLGQQMSRFLSGDSDFSKVARVIDRALIPIRNVPANVVNATARRIGGLPYGALEVAFHAIKGDMKDLPPEKRDAIFKRLSQGSVGALLVAAGYANPQIFGGFYQKGMNPDEVGQVGNTPKWLSKMISSNPIMMAVQFGATIRRNSDSKYVKQNKSSGTGTGVKNAVTGIAEHIPYVNLGDQLGRASVDGKGAGSWVADYLAGYYRPAQVKRLAQAYDTRTEDKPSLLEIPKYIVADNPKGKKRYVKGGFLQGVVQGTEKGIPKLRENVSDTK